MSHQRKLYVFLSILILLSIGSYIQRFPTGDDAWFAEQSYWFQKQGIIRSEFFRGILGWENQLLVSHKLFLIFGAGLIKLFGFGLPTVQFVGLFFFIILLVEIGFYIYQTGRQTYGYYILLAFILIFSNRVLVRLSFENRPELMLAALGLGSFLCIKSEQKKAMSAAFAGLLAGLAMLSHLNGVIYLIAGVTTYAYLRKAKEMLLFSVIGLLTALLYFMDVIQAKDGFAIWSYQFRNDPATQNAFGLFSKFMVMLTYPKLFFESPEQAALSILFVFMVWYRWEFIRVINRKLRIYFIVLIVAFWLLTKNDSGTYMPLFMPFMLLIIYELYKIKPFINFYLRIILFAYFIIGVYGIVEIIYKNYSLGNFPIAYRNLRNHIPKHTTGLVPLTFFFNEYEQYDHLLCHENFTFYSNSSADFPVWANQHKVDFILVDYKYRPEGFYPKPGTSKIPFYKLTFFDGRFGVYLKE